MSIHQSDLLSGKIGFKCNGGAVKKTKSFSLPIRSVEPNNSKNCTKKSFKLFVSHVNARKRGSVRSQSSSDIYVGSYSSDEGSIDSNGYSLRGIKEGTARLVDASVSFQHQPTVGSELTALAVPAIAAQALDPLAQLLETAYIGRLGPVALASAGVSVSIFNIVSKLFNIPLLSITTSFVAEDISKNHSYQDRADGGVQEKNSQSSNLVSEKLRLPSVSTALLLSALIGTLEAAALFFGSGLLLNIMGISTASPMRIPAEKFLALRSLGAPAVVVSLAVQGVFRGFKDTKTPLFCVGLGNVSSVVLLPLLAYSFGLGITGAAIATVASQYITMFLLIWSLNKSAVIFPPKMDDLQFGGYIKSGGLLLGRTLAVLLTMTLGTSMAARLGPLAMAAHQICLQVWLAVSLLADALAVSAQAMIAGSFAKHDYKRVKEITYFVLKTGLISGIALAIILFGSFGKLAELFTNDAEVLQTVKSGILFVSATQPINALAFVIDGLHYGVSDFAYAAYAMMTAGAISSIFLFYGSPIFGLPGVWCGLSLLMALRMAGGFLRLCWRNGPWWFLHRDNEISKFSVASDSISLLEADQDRQVKTDCAVSNE